MQRGTGGDHEDVALLNRQLEAIAYLRHNDFCRIGEQEFRYAEEDIVHAKRASLRRAG